MSSAKSGVGAPYWMTLGAVLLGGTFLRLPAALFEKPNAPLHALVKLHPQPAFTGVGFDGNLYRRYVNSIDEEGLWHYPIIVRRYIAVQKTLTGSILPPLRFGYIFAAYLWHRLLGTETVAAMRAVASFFGILSLLLGTIFAWRLKGPVCAMCVAALLACAPTQLHMTQHVLSDGFFAFWALFTLWLLWENLRAPGNWRWLLLYAIGLCAMVITKENAAFAFVAIVVLLVANRWLQWGIVTRELLACTVLGPLLGVVILVFLAGGVETLVTTYQLSVSKNYHLEYAILTGDGPWHRYLVDLLLVSPIILLLALGAVFRLDRTQKPELFLTVFIGASYLVMCNLKYGMNLRYANMWDMPLRVLAFSQLSAFAHFFPKRRALFLGATVAFIGAVELRQYIILFVDLPLYELVTEGLLRALKILKSPIAP